MQKTIPAAGHSAAEGGASYPKAEGGASNKNAYPKAEGGASNKNANTNTCPKAELRLADVNMGQ